MVIEMNEAQVRTVEQVRQVLEGTQVLPFRAAQDDEGRYGWIEAVLRRLRYRQSQRADKGARAAAPQDHNEQGKAFPAWQPLARWAVDKAQARVKQAVAVPRPTAALRLPLLHQKKPEVTAATLAPVHNGSTRFASPISSRSRLIPELEKTPLHPARRRINCLSAAAAAGLLPVPGGPGGRSGCSVSIPAWRPRPPGAGGRR